VNARRARDPAKLAKLFKSSMGGDEGPSAADMYKQYAGDARAHGRAAGCEEAEIENESEILAQMGSYVDDVNVYSDALNLVLPDMSKLLATVSEKKGLQLQLHRAQVGRALIASSDPRYPHSQEAADTERASSGQLRSRVKELELKLERQQARPDPASKWNTCTPAIDMPLKSPQKTVFQAPSDSAAPPKNSGQKIIVRDMTMEQAMLKENENVRVQLETKNRSLERKLHSQKEKYDKLEENCNLLQEKLKDAMENAKVAPPAASTTIGAGTSAQDSTAAQDPPASSDLWAAVKKQAKLCFGEMCETAPGPSQGSLTRESLVKAHHGDFKLYDKLKFNESGYITVLEWIHYLETTRADKGPGKGDKWANQLVNTLMTNIRRHKALEPVTKACSEVYEVMSAEEGGSINKVKLTAMEGSAFFEKLVADGDGNVGQEPWTEFFLQLTDEGKDALWIVTFLRRLITRALLNWKSQQRDDSLQVTIQLGEQIRETENRLQKVLNPTQEQAGLRLLADEAELNLLQTIAVENELKSVQVLKTKLSIEEMEHARKVQVHSYVTVHTHDVERSIKSMWRTLFSINEAMPYLRQVRAVFPYAQANGGESGEPVPVDACMRQAVEHLHNMEGFLDQLSGRINTHLAEVINENRLIRAVLDDAKSSGNFDPMVGFLCTNYEGQLAAIKEAHENEIALLHDSISAQVEKLHELHCTEMKVSREENARSKATSSSLKMELDQLEKATLGEIEELREDVAQATAGQTAHPHQRVPLAQLEASLADFEQERQKNLVLVRENANIRIEMHHLKQARQTGTLSLSENMPPSWPWLPTENFEKLPGVAYPPQSEAPPELRMPLDNALLTSTQLSISAANTNPIRPEAWKGAAKIARLLAGLGAEMAAERPLCTPLAASEANTTPPRQGGEALAVSAAAMAPAEYLRGGAPAAGRQRAGPG